MTLQDRLLHALALSLLGHALLLSIPLGGTGWTIDTIGIATLQLRPSTNFAPLQVALAPFNLRTPDRSIPGTVKTSQVPRTAAAIDSTGKEEGRYGDSSSVPDDSPATNPPTETLGLPVPYYYKPEELTQRAQILHDIDPTLGDLQDRPGTGKAIINLWINEQGAVDRAEIKTSNLSKVFEQAVLQQFSAALFQPAEHEGKPAKSQMKIEVEVLPRSRFSRNVAKENLPTP